MGSLLKFVKRPGFDMNIWLAVCCLLITGVLMAQSPQSGLNTGQAAEEFGFQDSANSQMRNVRETKSGNLKKTEKKTEKKTNKKTKSSKSRKNKKSRKLKKKTLNKKTKNKKNKKVRTRKSKDSKQNSCQTSSEVDGVCIQNAIDILGYEKNQILNFQKQKARIESHNRTANNKMKKRDSFQAVASTLLEAIGGNLNSPTCKDSTSSRMAATAVDTVNTLANCSSVISESCTIYNTTTITALQDCHDLFQNFKSVSANCRTSNTDNGPVACACWFNAYLGMRKLKEENCDAQPTAKAVKATRNNCITVFLKCKKAEDLAVSLVATCGDGAVKTKDGKTISTL